MPYARPNASSPIAPERPTNAAEAAAKTTMSAAKARMTYAVRRLLARICCWSVTAARLCLEAHGHGAPLVLIGGEELARLEPEQPCEEQRREGLDRGVVGLHGGVVVAPGGGDLVLGVGQLGLELPEVLGRLEVGVGLGDGEEPADRLPEQRVGSARRGRRRCVGH